LHLINLQDHLLSGDLLIDGGFELFKFFLQANKLESLHEAVVLNTGDFLLGSILVDLFFFGRNNDISDNDLLINMLLIVLIFLEALTSVGKISSGSGLLGDKLFSLVGQVLNLLPVDGDL
jgi:hypothetical protein